MRNALLIASLVLAAVAEFMARGKSLLGYAVILTDVAFLLHAF